MAFEFSRPEPRAILALGGASLALNAAAHGFERLGGLAPCLLCLLQREVHWMALATASVGAFAAWLIGARAPLKITLYALAAIFLVSFAFGTFHAGVEWDLWDGPQACASGRVQEAPDFGTDLMGSLNATAGQGPSCEEAAWRLLGISMAGYNALASLALAAIALLVAKRGRAK